MGCQNVKSVKQPERQQAKIELSTSNLFLNLQTTKMADKGSHRLKKDSAAVFQKNHFKRDNL